MPTKDRPCLTCFQVSPDPVPTVITNSKEALSVRAYSIMRVVRVKLESKFSESLGGDPFDQPESEYGPVSGKTV